MKWLLAPFYAAAVLAAALVDLLTSGTTHIRLDVQSLTSKHHRP